MNAMKYWLWLSGLVGLKPKNREYLLSHFGDPYEIYSAGDSDYRRLEECELSDRELELLNNKSLSQARRIMDDCDRLNVGIITLHDASYPVRLANIYDPPTVLYVKGRMPWVDDECTIGIVGTRKATPYGMKMARRMGYEITKGGGLVVSGLAAGIDTGGAEGAIRAGGKCIGVLGTAIDRIYPKINEGLYSDVSAVGALISEYPPGEKYGRDHFPQRNRIISGLSSGILVIEAPEKSGSLITADRALEQGRELFAVPGNADAFNCQGSNQLIKDGIKAVTCGWDILSEFTGQFPEKIHRPGTPKPEITEKSVYDTAEKRTEKTGKSKKSGKSDGKGIFGLHLPQRKKPEPEQKPEPENSAKKETLEKLSEEQLKLVSVMTEPSMHIDDIVEKSGLAAYKALSELTMLQISGMVSQEPGKRFTLNITVNSD